MTPSRSGRMAAMLPGRAAQHQLGFLARRQAPACGRAGRRCATTRRLVQHDPAPLHVDERVGGAEIDGHVGGHKAEQAREHALKAFQVLPGGPARGARPRTAVPRSRCRAAGRGARLTPRAARGLEARRQPARTSGRSHRSQRGRRPMRTRTPRRQLSKEDLSLRHPGRAAAGGGAASAAAGTPPATARSRAACSAPAPAPPSARRPAAVPGPAR